MLRPVLGLAISALANITQPAVTLRQGTFTGITLQEQGYSAPVNAFMGIPYAQPPVGDLRLRPPVAVNASEHAFNATRYGVQCPQGALVPAYAPDTPGMSEDCLTINVFQPSGVDFDAKNVPVAINIHGGAFNAGAGESGLWIIFKLLTAHIKRNLRTYLQWSRGLLNLLSGYR